MNKIEIYEGCTNNSVVIDGIDINDMSKNDIRKYLKEQIDNIDENYTLTNLFKELLEYNDNYKITKEYSNRCDQCGDYIWDRVYTKIEKK